MLEKGVQSTETSLAPPHKMLSRECAEEIYNICLSEGLLQDDCSLTLDASADSIYTILSSNIPASFQEEFAQNEVGVVKTILQSRYVNLHSLLRVSDSKER